MPERARQTSIWDPAIVRPAVVDSLRKLDPRIQVKNPVMFIVEVGSLITTVIWVQELLVGRREPALHRPGGLLALVHGALRELRRGDGRGPRQGPGREPAPDPGGDDGAAHPRRRAGDRGRERAAQGRRGAGDGRRDHPGRRRDHRGCRERRRVGHHRGVGARDPRVRRRPLGGHRRHARAVGLDRGAHHLQPGQQLPRPHDRPGGGRGAAEDAERDRAQHPAGGAEPGVPAGRGHAAAAGALRRHFGPGSRC